jgi:hypothetical protein
MRPALTCGATTGIDSSATSISPDISATSVGELPL